MLSADTEAEARGQRRLATDANAPLVYVPAVTGVLRTVFGLGVVLATAAPLLRAARDDSYPFSTYPMFARVLDKPELTVAVGVTAAREVLRLPPEMIANEEPMQAMRTLRQAGNGDRSALRALCSSIATRVARTPAFSQVRVVRIVRARFDPLTYFEGAPEPEQAQRLLQCRVKRAP
jgi:hypothetical protein